MEDVRPVREGGYNRRMRSSSVGALFVFCALGCGSRAGVDLLGGPNARVVPPAIDGGPSDVQIEPADATTAADHGSAVVDTGIERDDVDSGTELDGPTQDRTGPADAASEDRARV